MHRCSCVRKSNISDNSGSLFLQPAQQKPCRSFRAGEAPTGSGHVTGCDQAGAQKLRSHVTESSPLIAQEAEALLRRESTNWQLSCVGADSVTHQNSVCLDKLQTLSTRQGLLVHFLNWKQGLRPPTKLRHSLKELDRTSSVCFCLFPM